MYRLAIIQSLQEKPAMVGVGVRSRRSESSRVFFARLQVARASATTTQAEGFGAALLRVTGITGDWSDSGIPNHYHALRSGL